MKKINPFSESRPPVKTETRTFTDPVKPHLELELSLRSLDKPEMYRAMDIGDEIFLAYNGDQTNGILPSKAMPPLDGRPIVVGRSLCISLSILMAQQTGTSVEDTYSFEQLAGLMAVIPSAMTAALKWSNELNRVEAPKD